MLHHRALALALTTTLMLGINAASCECAEPPSPPGDDPDCVLDVDCPDASQVCRGGACVVAIPSEGEGEGEEGEGEGEGEAPLGILSVLPGDDVEFGAVRLGAAVERNITLRNTGPVALTIVQIVIDDNDAGTFAAEPTGALNQVLAPNGELGMLLVHTPNDGVPDTAELKILHTGAGQLSSVAMRAEFKGVSTLSVTDDAAVLTPDIVEVDVGDVAIGESRAVTLFVRNDGDADSVLTVAGASLTPSNIGFGIAVEALPRALSSFDGLCTADVAECPPGTSACTAGVCVDLGGVPVDAVAVTITFAPTSPEDREASFTVRSDVGGIADTGTDFVVRGRGVAGELDINPAAVVFEEVFVGSPQRRTVTVTNIGGAATTLTTATLLFPGATFTLEHALPSILAPNDTITLDVVFAPGAAGQFNNIINWDVSGAGTDPQTVITANARLAPQVGLYDAARAALDLDAAAVGFGDLFIGRQTSRVLRIVNDGPAGSTLAVRRMVLEGPQADRFTFAPTTIDQQLAGNINLEPHVDLTVTYLPQALTGIDDTATLVIETDDPARPIVELDLIGRAIRPVIVVDPLAVDFGPVLVGTNPSPARTVTIRNDGIGPLVVSEITAPGLAVYGMTTSTPLPTTLQPFATMTATLTYTPLNPNNFVASTSIEVRSTDLDRGPVTVSVVGSSGGCPPRGNASVVVVGSTCTYTCNGGFHACGDSCLSNTSPDSCGTSCTPCQTRTNANRGCTQATSTCTYSCDADARDLNGNLSVGQGSGSDGCEYECPVFPTTTEQCLGGDQDCDGQVDEGLLADDFDRNGGSSINTNDNCSVADRISNIPEDGIQSLNATIYPMPSIGGTDEDWYRVTVDEADAFCNPFGDEDFRVTVRLTGIASGSDYDLFLHNDDCGGSIGSSQAVGSANDTIVFEYDGSCGFDDNRTFRVRIKRFSGGTCDDYQLSVQFQGI